jgi:formate dehydrogenase subunit gamma
MDHTTNQLRRYAFAERVLHWLVALTFFAAGLTGLAFFHPSMFWLTGLFGGGPWSRILHPFFGVAMFLFFALLALKLWRHNVIEQHDREWLRNASKVMAGDEHGVPEAGRYNGGQKVLYWLLVLCMLVLLVTGIVFWRPYFAGYFPITSIRAATLLHAVAAAGLFLLVIGHIYMAIWTKGSIGAMMSGLVPRAWARKHHPRWYREETAKS